MESARRNADGTLTIPARAEANDGTIGDGLDTIGPDDPRFGVWDRWLGSGDEAVEHEAADDVGQQD